MHAMGCLWEKLHNDQPFQTHFHLFLFIDNIFPTFGFDRAVLSLIEVNDVSSFKAAFGMVNMPL